jgi:chemotaxis protein CheX
VIKTFEIAPHADTAIQVVQDVFKTMLYSDVRESSSEDYNRRSTGVTAAIFFNGEWRGATYIECSEQQALCFTQQLMGIPSPTEIDSDVGDAMGELVNMVGGNLKSALPRGVSLSLPCVLKGKDHNFHVCKVNESFRIAFAGEYGTFWITICTYVR